MAATRVLIVDDNELVRSTLARCCEVPDLIVVGTLSSAAEAVDDLAKYHPDVALVDHRLGDGDGITLAAKLMDLDPSLKVLIVTGSASIDLEQAARDAGCVGCVEKTMLLGRALPDLIRAASGVGNGLTQ